VTSSAAPTAARADGTRRLLRWVAIVAFVDFLLLIVLVIAAVSDAESTVSVLGPIHGIGFLLELLLAAKGSVERRWGWWFPVAVVVTGGPLGALIGHVKVTRDLGRPLAAGAVG
jgi:hypothetical protein